MNDENTEQKTRRRNLAWVIEEFFDGKQAAFIERTGINQGELSSLLKNKSFGEKKARKLEKDAGLPPGILDQERILEEGRAATEVRLMLSDTSAEYPQKKPKLPEPVQKTVDLMLSVDQDVQEAILDVIKPMAKVMQRIKISKP